MNKKTWRSINLVLAGLSFGVAGGIAGASLGLRDYSLVSLVPLNIIFGLMFIQAMPTHEEASHE